MRNLPKELVETLEVFPKLLTKLNLELIPNLELILKLNIYYIRAAPLL